MKNREVEKKAERESFVEKLLFFKFGFNKKIKAIILFIVISNIIIAAWYVINKDLNFGTDIARDFLILAEIETKKFILIGARAGAAGFFHGPLWYYLNFPVYFLSKGNPVAVEWFWIILYCLFYYYSFIIAKKLFNEKTAYIYLLLVSSYLIPHIKETTHPEGALMIMPILFYIFWKYINTFEVKYILSHAFLNGLLIHLEFAFGAPYFLLSSIYILYIQFKMKKLYHFPLLIIIMLPLSTYIFFDFRHNFFMLKSLITYINGSPSEHYVSFAKIFKNRLEYLTMTGIPIITNAILFNRILSLAFVMSIVTLIRKKEANRKLYTVFLFIFLGYFILSLKNRYYLLEQHFRAFIPIVLIFFSSIVISKYRKFFLPLLFVVIIYNEIGAINYIVDSKNFIGKNEDSWKFLSTIVNEVFSGKEKEFGYFVYSPDKFAYEPKYMMVYGAKNHPEKNAFYFQKKPTTYIVAAPPPLNDPYMTSDFWVANSINIKKNPQKEIVYPNGYKILRFELTPEEIAIPFDKNEDTGLHFR